jgi:hypothetical protein
MRNGSAIIYLRNANMLNRPGQAVAPRIEVTPDMVAAAAEVLEKSGIWGRYAARGPGFLELDDVARDMIYAALAANCPKSTESA